MFNMIDVAVLRQCFKRFHIINADLAPVDTDSILHDLDTWADYQRALARSRSGRPED